MDPLEFDGELLRIVEEVLQLTPPPPSAWKELGGEEPPIKIAALLFKIGGRGSETWTALNQLLGGQEDSEGRLYLAALGRLIRAKKVVRKQKKGQPDRIRLAEPVLQAIASTMHGAQKLHAP